MLLLFCSGAKSFDTLQHKSSIVFCLRTDNSNTNRLRGKMTRHIALQITAQKEATDVQEHPFGYRYHQRKSVRILTIALGDLSFSEPLATRAAICLQLSSDLQLPATPCPFGYIPQTEHVGLPVCGQPHVSKIWGLAKQYPLKVNVCRYEEKGKVVRMVEATLIG